MTVFVLNALISYHMIQYKRDKDIASCALAIYDIWQKHPSSTIHIHMTKR